MPIDRSRLGSDTIRLLSDEPVQDLRGIAQPSTDHQGAFFGL